MGVGGGRELGVHVRVVGQSLSLNATAGGRTVVGLSATGHQTLAAGGTNTAVLAALAAAGVVRGPLVLSVTLEGRGQATTKRRR